MFKCDICKKEKAGHEVGTIRVIAHICWFLIYLLPGVPNVPPSKVCKKCEGRGNTSVWYVAIFLGFVGFVLLMIPIANWAYRR